MSAAARPIYSGPCLSTGLPKADATFRFGVQGLRAGDQRVKLQVTTDEVRDPIVEEESTQVYADE